jgi:glucose/arabinose dehydrogenase
MKHASVFAIAAACLVGCSFVGDVTGVDHSPVTLDVSPLALKVVPAFPNLQFRDWEPDRDGRPTPLRPILLTHFGDGSNRLVVPEQQGRVHIFFNRPDAESTTIFLDLSHKVVYNDGANEEGLLGLAFHPRYGSNGEFFVYYTTTEAPHTSVISRFRVSPTSPNRADLESEEEVLRILQPHWNHNGGTLCFGPDGYLYIGMGDGGAANDPDKNGQNLQTLHGKILRIDVDSKAPGLAYGIPPDNPYAHGEPAGARPEIYALGIRNIWRMAFDREAGTLWAADVGQDRWEEINLIQKGGNYGWSLREGRHDFQESGVGPQPHLIEPIWEYAHDVGKSITGGCVYRGTNWPELTGHYLYADYVTAKIWALQYDERRKSVVAHRSIPYDDKSQPIVSFGEDEAGEVYFTVVTAKGVGIYTFGSE